MKMIVRPISKAEVIKCLTHPRVWPHSGQAHTDPRDYELPDGPVYLGFGDPVTAAFTFQSTEYPWVFMAHHQIMPESWGEIGIEAGKDAIKFMHEQHGAMLIIGEVQMSNTLAISYAKKVGMFWSHNLDDKAIYEWRSGWPVQ